MPLPSRCWNWLLRAALALAALAPLAACQNKTTLQTYRQTPYLALPGAASRVVSFDLQRLRTLESFKSLYEVAQQAPDLKPILTALRERAKFDLLQDADVVIVARERGPADPSEPLKHLIVIARGRFPDPAVKLEALRQWLGEEYLISPPPFEPRTHPHGDFKKYETRAQSQYSEKIYCDLNFAFPAPDLMVFAGSPGLLSDALDVIAGAAPGLGPDVFWKQMLRRPNLGAAIWGAGELDLGGLIKEVEPLLASAAGLSKGRQFYFQFDFAGSYQAEVDVVCSTIADATDFTTSFKAYLTMQSRGAERNLAQKYPETAKLPSRFVAINELETCKITLSLTPDQRKALVPEWVQFLSDPKNPPPSSILSPLAQMF